MGLWSEPDEYQSDQVHEADDGSRLLVATEESHQLAGPQEHSRRRDDPAEIEAQALTGRTTRVGKSSGKYSGNQP